MFPRNNESEGQGSPVCTTLSSSKSMIIHSPRTTPIGDDTLVSAAIELQNSGRKIQEPLWFRFPAFSQPSGDADPFVLALPLLAMQNGEDIEVRGSVSGKLLEGLD